MAGYAELTFTTGAYAAKFVEQVAAAVATSPPKTILDLGCGTGGILLALARRYTQSHGTGIDLSPSSIAAGQAAAARENVAERIDFRVADYAREPLPAFDLIVCYSTLHLIDCDKATLIAKIATEMAPDGALALAVPVECAFNRWLTRLRRLFRAVRSNPTDSLLLHAGMMMTRGRYSRDQIAERIAYMYLPPRLFWGEELAKLFAEQGVSLISCRPEAHASIAQLKHVTVILRKSA